uniref:Uncharacterized protein n=1 Tax=Dechloromonas aromatica (strain RCB) TaxID=159087 RepID=Q478P7_DECAR
MTTFKNATVFWLVLIGLFFCKTAFPCEAIDSSFALSGLVISSTADTTQAVGSVARLERMLKAVYPTKVRGHKLESAHLSVDRKTQILVISYEQENTSQPPSIDYDVYCIGDEWGYSRSTQLSTDGSYREVVQEVRLKLLPNGDLEVRNADAISRGLILKTKELFSVSARFSKAGVRRADE